MTRTVVATVAVLAIGAVCLLAQAGTLEPPGPPAPTMKTLDQVESRIPIHQADIPLTITQPGSYYLAESLDLTGLADPANTTAIQITAPDVTIDLNGFAITGPTVCVPVPLSCSPTGVGVGILSASLYTTVLNGTVRGMGGNGIELVGGAIRDVSVHHNGGHGIKATNARVVGNHIELNGGDGVNGSNNEVTNNYISSCQNGVSAGGISNIAHNRIQNSVSCGLLFSGTSNGYAGNIMRSNPGGNVCGTGTQLAPNICTSGLCP